jgi:hypothetical protein
VHKTEAHMFSRKLFCLCGKYVLSQEISPFAMLCSPSAETPLELEKCCSGAVVLGFRESYPALSKQRREGELSFAKSGIPKCVPRYFMLCKIHCDNLFKK